MILDIGCSILDEGQKNLNMPNCINRVTSIENRVSSIEYRETSSIQHQLNSITSNIGQFIFEIIINPFFVIRQRIFSAAGPAAQTNRLSGPMYPKWCLAKAALKKITILHPISLT